MSALEIFGWFIVLILGILAYIWYDFRKSYGYWKKLGVPYSPGKHFIGSMGELYKHSFHEVEVMRYKKYGRIYGHFEGKIPQLTVGDPELLRNILIKDFQYFCNRRIVTTGNDIFDNMLPILNGEKWKRVRTIMSPTFSTGKIKKVTSIILDSADTLVENFKIAAEAGKTINAKNLFSAFSMDVIVSSAFGTKIDSHNDPNNRFMTESKKIFGAKFIIRLILFFVFPKLMKFLRLSVFPKNQLNFLKEITLKIIEQRKSSGEKRNDFLQLMMDASETNTNDSNEDNENVEEKPQKKLTSGQKHLTNNEIISQSTVFFMAGFETTAAALAFVAYNLALYPEIQDRLFEEIDEVIKQNKGEITYDGVQSMKYLDAVISETLRIFPPGTRIERQTEEDYVLGDTGITITKGMLVGIPVYAMHHDPEYYPDPEKFDPDRFTPEAKAERNPFTYLPFGAGPRNCVAMRFALMEMKLCLAKLLTQVKVKKCPQTKIPLEYNNGHILLMPKEISLAIEKREPRHA